MENKEKIEVVSENKDASEMTKKEKIDEIVNLSRENSEIKNKKKLERKLSSMRLGLFKCTNKEIDDLYAEIKEKGMKQFCEEKSAQYR